MSFKFWKKHSKKVELSKEAIDELQEQLQEKIAEFKAIYHQLVDAGDIPLPEEVLATVAGGVLYGTTVPSATTPFPTLSQR